MAATLIGLLIASFAAGCIPRDVGPQPYGLIPEGPGARELFADAAARGLLCERLRDRFIALPGVGAAPNPALPKEGRLRVVSCMVSALANQLSLRITGPAWVWVDREHSGFRVRQYVYFVVDVYMIGALDIGYDQNRKLATVWVTPVGPASVSIRPLGHINASPQTLAALLIDAVTLGTVSSERARDAVETQGAQAFRQAIHRGATVTYDLHHRQFDVAVGHLPRGVAEQRPFNMVGPWWANERVRVRPGGPHVLGPFKHGAGVTLVTETAVVPSGAQCAGTISCKRSKTSCVRSRRGCAPMPSLRSFRRHPEPRSWWMRDAPGT
jgi:hypothetical protein